MEYADYTIDGFTGEITTVRHWTETEIAQAKAEVLANAPANVRRQRDALLAETDTWGLADFPATAEQTAYRQALRDITAQAGFPTDITWPTKPEQKEL